MYERSSYDLPLTIFSHVAIKSTVVVSHPSDVPPSYQTQLINVQAWSQIVVFHRSDMVTETVPMLVECNCRY